MSLGQIVKGASLSIEMTPVGVRDPVMIELLGELCNVGVEVTSREARDGQHSGRSSEQPISGT